MYIYSTTAVFWASRVDDDMNEMNNQQTAYKKKENTNLENEIKYKEWFYSFSPFVCLSSCVYICISVEYVVMSVFDGVVRENILYQYHFNALLKKMKMNNNNNNRQQQQLEKENEC